MKQKPLHLNHYLKNEFNGFSHQILIRDNPGSEVDRDSGRALPFWARRPLATGHESPFSRPRSFASPARTHGTHDTNPKPKSISRLGTPPTLQYRFSRAGGYRGELGAGGNRRELGAGGGRAE